MDFGNLIKALEIETEIYKKFAEIENEKTAVILEGNIEKLDGILNAEQELHMKVQNVEKMRIAVIKSFGLGLENKTLLDIIGLSENKQKKRLSELFEDLNDCIGRIKQINEHNTMLVKSRLEIISAVNGLYLDPKTGAKVKQAGGSPQGDNINIYGKDAKISRQPGDFERKVVRKRL